LIFRQRRFNVDRGADLDQSEQSSRRLAMQPNTAVGVSHWPNESFVEAVCRLEFAPIGHRIATIRLGRPPTVLLLVINREVTSWSLGPRLTHVTLNRHQEAVAFHYVKVLGGGGK